jgi:hypothetical protein
MEMSAMMETFDLATLLWLFLLMHLTVGGIRGVHRYQICKRYYYNYNDFTTATLAGRVKRNLLHGMFTIQTLYISMAISSVIVATFLFM